MPRGAGNYGRKSVLAASAQSRSFGSENNMSLAVLTVLALPSKPIKSHFFSTPLERFSLATGSDVVPHVRAIWSLEA